MGRVAVFVTQKVVYIFIALLFVLSFAILKAPRQEVFVDIQISPPEEVRRTDFSWITVGEWFNTQAYIITSYNVLKDVKSEINIVKLKAIVSAKRLGAADIIRISARSDESAGKLEKAVSDIANTYLKRLDHGYILTPPTVKLFPGLGIKLLLGCPLGFLIWFSTGLILIRPSEEEPFQFTESKSLDKR